MAGTKTEGGATAPAAADRLGYAAGVLIFYAACLALVLGDVADGKLFHGDVDDHLRALQIGHLFSDKAGWFDLTLPFVQMPEAYVSPWSRLVDLPYVVLGRFAGLVMPSDDALRLAFLVWPPLLLLGFSALVVAIARRIGDGFVLPPLTEALIVIATAVTMAIGVMEFSPGRIDHHNVQIVAGLLICLGLVRWDWAGGLLLGAGSTASIVVGLECLPFVAVAYAGVAVAWLFGVNGSRAVLSGAALAMLAATPLAAGAFLGPMALSMQCDAFSAPYILLMAGFSLVLFAAARFAGGRGSMARSLALLLLPSAVLLGVAAILFPACLDGPYAMIDPVSRAGWFERIWQEQSFLHLVDRGQSSLLTSLALVAALLVAAAVTFAKRVPAAGALVVFALAAVSLGLALYVTRFIRFPIVFAPLFLPAVAGFLLTGGLQASRRAAGLAAGLAVAALVALHLSATPREPVFDAIDYMAFDECQTGDFALLGTVAPGRIAMPQALALPIIAAMPEGFSVAAIPFHRAAPGMRRMLEAFTTHDPDIRRAALAPFDYVAVCRFALQPEPGDSPFYTALSAGAEWPGLIRLDDGRNDFQLFRVDHAALR